MFSLAMSYEGSITPPISDDESSCDVVTSPILKQRIGIRSGITLKTNMEEEFNEQFYEASVDLMMLEKELSSKLQLPNDRKLKNMKTFINSVEQILNKPNPQAECIFNALELLCGLSTNIVSTVAEEVGNIFSANLLSIKLTNSCASIEVDELFDCFCDINSLLLDIVNIAIKLDFIPQTYEVYHSDGTLVQGEASSLNKTVQRIIKDIAYINANVFQSLNASNIRREVPFYSCKLLSKCSSLLQCEDFWSIIIKCVNLITQSNSTYLCFDSTSSTLSFCWWWIKSMPLNSTISSCFTLINSMLRRSLATCMKQPTVISFHICCYKEVVMNLQKCMSGRQWKPAELAGFTLLWQNISQNFLFGNKKTLSGRNDLFSVSVQDWLSQREKLHSLSQVASFDCFTAFLSVINFLLSYDNGSVWLLLKDRFLQRFQSPMMKQLTDIGLHHYFSIVLIVLQSCPQSHADAALKTFVSLLNHISMDSSNAAKVNVCFTGLFALMHVCCHRELSCQLPVTKAGECFKRLSQLLVVTSTKPEQHFQVLKSLSSFFDCVIDFMKLDKLANLNLILPLHCITAVVSGMISDEPDTIVQFVHEMIVQARNFKQPTFTQYFHSFVEMILPCLQKCTFDKLQIITELTVVLSSRSTYLPHFCQIWKYFASEGQVEDLIRCRYLRDCLLDNGVFNLVNNHEVEDHKSSLTCADYAIRGWLKSIALLSDVESAVVEQILKCVSKLKVIENMKQNECDDFSLELFLKLLVVKHKSANDFLERMSWTNQANVWIAPLLDIFVQALSKEKYLNSVYLTSATIIQHCSLLLHVGKPPVVSRFLTVFIMNPDKRNELVLSRIYKFIDKFMIGCLTIGTKDIYMNQAMKQILSSYITKWSIPSKHPFLKLLLQLESNRLVSMLELLRDLLMNNFQTNKLVMVVEILYEWSKSTKAKPHGLSNFNLALVFVQPQLRFSTGIPEKIDTLLKYFA